MNVRITPCTSPAELHRHYDGQSEPQPAYIELDTQAGTLHATYDAEVGGAVPFSVHYGLDRRYGIPVLTAGAANRVMEEIAPFADRIIAGTAAEWDGSNTVAVLDTDALAAEEQLEQYLGLPTEDSYGGAPDQGFDDSDLVAAWDIDGATTGFEAEEYDITADTTDGRLDEIEQEILAGLAECNGATVAVCHGLDSHLRTVRDDLADEDPLTDAELRTAREQLGLTGDHLARLLRVNPRTLRSWEQGRDPIPGRIRPEVAELKAATAAAVAEAVAGVGDEEEPVLITYRSDEEYRNAHPAGRWTASWHRQVCARAAEESGARIEYAEPAQEEMSA